MIDNSAGGRLVIRTAVPAEAEAVSDLMVRARSTYYPDGIPDADADWTARWHEAIARRDGHVLCAVDQGRIVGIASFRTPPDGSADTVTLFQFHVDPGRWRSGIGTALHAACVEQWRTDGRRTAVLEVHAGNERAQRFYTRQGWTPDPLGPADEGGHHLGLRYTVTGE
ncbi:GNAT family N-acetyltransferase [Streptomyces sp. NPDC056817]|uniref:GNAT family N-acetyltransferase n=1 Tax=Streptomyces sp. NPDC056817 TaxID=3345950 RepID=UPI0036CAF6F7